MMQKVIEEIYTIKILYYPLRLDFIGLSNN